MLAPETVSSAVSDDVDVALSDMPQRVSYQALEHGQVDVPASEMIVDGKLDIYPEVAKGDFFKVSFKKQEFSFQAAGYVGIIPVNDRVALDVRPRVPVANLEYIVNVAEHQPTSLTPYQRRYNFHHDEAPSLLGFLSEALIEQVQIVEAQGVLRNYELRSEDTSFPRGRIDIDGTLRLRARGLNHRVSGAWFEQSIDIAPNRCLKYALSYLLRHYQGLRSQQGARQMTARLSHCFRLFENVLLQPNKQFLLDSVVREPRLLPTNRAYYRDALALAVSIIEKRGINFGNRGHEVGMISLLLNMDKVFEDYLRTALAKGMSALNPRVRVLDGNKTRANGDGAKKLYFDAKPSEWATPDIVLAQEVGADSAPENLAVLEVKYKPKKAPTREDLNQVVAYAASYRVSVGVLLMPCAPGESSGLSLLGHMGNLRIYRYAFSLSAEHLAAEESLFAREMLKVLGEKSVRVG